MRSDFVELDIRLLQCEGMLLNGISISLQGRTWTKLERQQQSLPSQVKSAIEMS
jgi:hypothetical protein